MLSNEELLYRGVAHGSAAALNAHNAYAEAETALREAMAGRSTANLLLLQAKQRAERALWETLWAELDTPNAVPSTEIHLCPKCLGRMIIERDEKPNGTTLGYSVCDECGYSDGDDDDVPGVG